MSIDESIEQIHLLKQLEDGLGNISGNTNTKVSQACAMAIDTMRKFQKIEQILKDIPYGGDVTVRRIQEVVEDGNVD